VSAATASVLITGGGSGIGLACAARFLAGGAHVTIAGRSAERLQAAAEGLDSDRLSTVVCDVGDEDAVAAAIGHSDRNGPLRTIVAAAGTGWIAPISQVPLHAWQRVIDTNLTGTFLALKHATPRLAANGGGAFIAISSVNSVLSSRFHAPYCATKAAVDMLVRSAADELGAAGIRVNAVRPGLVPTLMSGPLVADASIREDFLEQMPIRRLGTVDDIAAAVAWLASDAATWITGVCLDVDGGHHLRRGENFDPWIRQEHPDPPAWWGVH
jgi:NAD(P)-dependent dehydrogenase (short-subunit alcohol dehydrogenase family)